MFIIFASMRLNFHKPQSNRLPSKATIHRSGKLGFSSEAEKMLELGTEKSLKIATNADDPEDDNLYVMVLETIENDSFSLKKAGQYFYINGKQLFEDLKVDFKKDKIIYDIEEFVLDGQTLFKFNKRVVKNKKNDMPPDNLGE